MASKSKLAFDIAMKDVDQLVQLFKDLNTENSGDYEVLKRSALIMSFTAWETYVEDRSREFVRSQMGFLKEGLVEKYITTKLEKDLMYFHNPKTRKTKELYKDIIGDDITQFWEWNNFDCKRARSQLDEYIKLRGEVVHRSVIDKTEMHVVKKEVLKKCIQFLNDLAEAMDRKLNQLSEY